VAAKCFIHSVTPSRGSGYWWLMGGLICCFVCHALWDVAVPRTRGGRCQKTITNAGPQRARDEREFVVRVGRWRWTVVGVGLSFARRSSERSDRNEVVGDVDAGVIDVVFLWSSFVVLCWVGK